MSNGRSQIRANWVRQRLAPTTERSPQYGIFASAAFHGAIFAAALFTFHRDFETPQDSHVVPVDLVTIAEKTNVAAQAPPAPKLEKLDIPPPVLEAPPVPQMEDVEPAPVPDMPKFDIKKPEVPATKKNVQQDFAALLNKLTAPQKQATNAHPSTRVVQGIGTGNQMTADLSDALKSQMYRCWSPPTGAPDARDLIVDYDLHLNPDGTIASLEMTPSTAVAAAGNGYTRAAAEAASRAVYECQPYKLPPQDYNLWREINPLRFDPRQMMEQ